LAVALALWLGSTSWWQCLAEQHCLLHGQEAKERKRKESEFQNSLQGHTFNDLKISYWVPPQISHHLSIAPPWGASPYHMDLWEPFKILTIAEAFENA
jgi:hypothetical protein